MNKISKITLSAIIILALPAVTVWCLLPHGKAGASMDPDTTADLRGDGRRPDAVDKSEQRVSSGVDYRVPSRRSTTTGADSLEITDKSSRASPDGVALPLNDEEKALTQLEREILAELRKCANTGSLMETRKVFLRLRELAKARGVSLLELPVALRRTAVSAASRHGVGCIGDLFEMAGDPEATVATSVSSSIQMTLMDPSLSDSERGALIIKAAQEMPEGPALASTLMMVNMSRHSVGINTILEISETGSDAAKEMVPKLLETFTFQQGIETREQAEAWLKANPDSKYDDQFYGGFKGF